MRRLIYFIIGCAWFLHMTLVYAGPGQPHAWVALAEEGGAYAEAAAVLRAEAPEGMTVTAGKWQTLLDVRQAPPDMIVTIGVAAFEGSLKWLAEQDAAWARVPVLAILLPRAAYEETLARGPVGRRIVSAVVLDQPVGRQMALLRRALPDRRLVSVIPGPQTQPLMGALEREAGVRGLKLVRVPGVSSPEGIYPALKTALDAADVILALPEPIVYNSGSLQNILLTTYRARVPLVAFSAAYVKAGAVLALYSTPAQVARRAVGMLRSWSTGRGLPPPQAPQEFAVAANAKVAASLGLQLDDASVIAEDLRREEGTQ
jgi:hypothetical protein